MSGPQHKIYSTTVGGAEPGMPGPYFAVASLSRLLNTHPFSDYDSLLTRYAMRFFACLNMLKDYALPLLFSFAILFLLLCFARQDAVKADLLWPLILLAHPAR